jgi:hypothetical protein
MEVSWSEAQRAETNVIARSVDRATTMQRRPRDDNHATTMQRQPRNDKRISSTIVAQRGIILCARDSNPLHKGLQSSAQRTRISCAGIRAVVAAGDYVRAKTPLRSVLTLTSIAPTPLDIHILCRRAVVATGDYVRAKTPLRSVLTLTSIAPTPLDIHILCRRAVVATGDYVRAKTPLRSVLTLTSIAPTPLDVHILCHRSVVATGDYVRAKLRCAPSDAHIHRPYSRRYRVGFNVSDTKYQFQKLNR